MFVGYTAGVFDLFHIGHLNLLRNAKSLCDRLIVGVTVDSLVEYKGKKSVIPYEERAEIVRSIKYVDLVVPQTNLDKLDAYHRYKYDILVVGDDWYGENKWNKYVEKLKEFNVDVFFMPYTKTTSSTLINKTLIDLREKK